MSRYVTLDARISIDAPRSTYPVICFKDHVFNKVLQFRLLVLELVGQNQARKAGADSCYS